MQNQDTNDKQENNYSDVIAHLIELRSRLVKAFSAVLIIFFALVYWAGDIYNIFVNPLKTILPNGSQIVFGDVTGVFLIPLKITFFISLLIALPWVLYQIWLFVVPALYDKEKKLMLPLIISSYSLFWCGLLFVYYVILPMIFKFVIGYSKATNTAMLTQANEYLDFSLQLFISFGLIFEIPVAIFILVLMNVLSTQKLAKIRPYIIVISFIISAIVTPPDPFSQIFMAIPICLLYELGLLVAKYFVRNNNKYKHHNNEIKY
jgi:sec-independent protein translocase protein TatC